MGIDNAGNTRSINNPDNSNTLDMLGKTEKVKRFDIKAILLSYFDWMPDDSRTEKTSKFIE